MTEPEATQSSGTPSEQQLLTSVFQQYHTPNYAPSMVLVKGRGAYVWDGEGNKYLDFVTGLAVNTLGHCHPAIVRALRKQMDRLIHASNLYYNDQSPWLAKELSERSMGGKAFLCNSGAEANEAMIKLARLWGNPQGRHEIITFENSFHGRTLATLTATGQEKVQKGFEPLPEGFHYAKYNQIDSVKKLLTDKTVAVMLETVQAEGGVVVAEPAFLQELAAFCKENSLLLLIDEVQTGVGRTGEWFSYQHEDLEPDAISTAKGLGGGFPIGALLTSPRLQDLLVPGTHGSTFGGQPMACAAALAVLDTIGDKGLVDNAAEMGDFLQEKLSKLVKKYDFITGVRGKGLIQGLVLDQDAKDLERMIARKGLLTIATAGNVIRLLPPLTVTPVQIRKAVRMIDKACSEWQELQPVSKEDSAS